MKRIEEAGYLEVSDLLDCFCVINDFLEFIALKFDIEPGDVKRRFCEDTLEIPDNKETGDDS